MKESSTGIGKMDQQVKAFFTTKSDNLNSYPRTPMMEGENQPLQVTLDFNVKVRKYTHTSMPYQHILNLYLLPNDRL